jgi:CRP-like cAMP-binding protein
MNLAIDALKKGEIMGKVPLFRYLNYADVTKLLAVSTVQSFPKGSIIIAEDTIGEEMSIICSGSAQVTKAGQTLAQLVKGDIFGEMSICDHAKRSASVIASEPTVLMTLKRADLLPLFRREAQLAVKFLWALNQDLNHRLRVASRGLADAKAALQLLGEQQQGRQPIAPA